VTEALRASRSFPKEYKRRKSLAGGSILLFICGLFLFLSLYNFLIALLRDNNLIGVFLGVAVFLSISCGIILWGMRRVYLRGYLYERPVVYDAVRRNSYSLPSPPEQMIFNASNNMLYIASRDRIMVLDGTTDHIVDEIPISGPRYFAINFPTDKLFVAQQNGISVIDMSSNKVIKNIFEEYSYGQLCINNKTNMLYAINKSYSNRNISSNYVDVIDCSSSATISRINSQWKPSGIAVNPSNNRLYVGFEKHPSIFVFDDSKDNLCISRIHLPIIDHSELYSNSIYFDASNDLLYILQERIYSGGGGPPGWAEFLLKIDANMNLSNYYIHEFDCNILSKTERYLPMLRSKSVLKEDEILRGKGNPGDSITLNPKTGLLYFTNTEKKKLDEIDTNTNTVLNTFEISQYCHAMALNPVANKLYLITSSGIFGENILDIIYLQKESTVNPPLSIENSSH
jgi:DNA-binding beta-propeller fold protein YncE